MKCNKQLEFPHSNTLLEQSTVNSNDRFQVIYKQGFILITYNVVIAISLCSRLL